MEPAETLLEQIVLMNNFLAWVKVCDWLTVALEFTFFAEAERNFGKERPIRQPVIILAGHRPDGLSFEEDGDLPQEEIALILPGLSEKKVSL